MFTSTVVINFYTTSNIVILGFFAPLINVGFFSAAMKLVSVVQSLITIPLNQSLYPHIGNSFSMGYEIGIDKLKKVTALVAISTFLLSLLLFFLAPLLVKIILGDSFLPSILTLRILSFLPFMIALSNVFGIQGLLNMKKDKVFFKVTLIGAIINIILNFILTPFIFQNGTALAWMITEVFITICFFMVLLKLKINLLDIKFFKPLIINYLKVIKRKNY